MERIAICAPATPITHAIADRVRALANTRGGPDLHFHEQCFVREGHFAGGDEVRLAALLDCANDPAFDAVWFAKGGYGSNRIAERAVALIGESGRTKTYCGYSDCGFLLAALYRAGIGRQAHSPMPVDIGRDGGAAAVERVLDWFSGDTRGLEPHCGDAPTAAFNLTTLAMLAGTRLMPDLSGHVVMVEEVAEHLYAIDRLFFHISQHLEGIAGLRLGRFSKIPVNDYPFGAEPEEIARYWCAQAGIAFLGRADIGHDVENAIVPFGLAAAAARP